MEGYRNWEESNHSNLSIASTSIGKVKWRTYQKKNALFEQENTLESLRIPKEGE